MRSPVVIAFALVASAAAAAAPLVADAPGRAARLESRGEPASAKDRVFVYAKGMRFNVPETFRPAKHPKMGAAFAGTLRDGRGADVIIHVYALREAAKDAKELGERRGDEIRKAGGEVTASVNVLGGHWRVGYKLDGQVGVAQIAWHAGHAHLVACEMPEKKLVDNFQCIATVSALITTD